MYYPNFLSDQLVRVDVRDVYGVGRNRNDTYRGTRYSATIRFQNFERYFRSMPGPLEDSAAKGEMVNVATTDILAVRTIHLIRSPDRIQPQAV